MTDAHTHVRRGEARNFLCSPFTGSPGENDFVFYGTHPWFLDEFDADALRRKLMENPSAGVGEIGLDRLHEKNISPRMREVFELQLQLAEEFNRSVVLHGAKCWGEVVAAVKHHHLNRPMLFHGFSRSGGLIPEIIELGGYISVGPALLNDHAVNYRELVKGVPLDRILVESDATADNAGSVSSIDEISGILASILGIKKGLLTDRLEQNADSFIKLA